MAPPPPPPDAIAGAWELRTQGYPYREIAEVMRSRGFKCDSLETARQWSLLGAQAARFVEILDKTEERYRLADGLDQDMAALRKLVNTGLASVLEVMPHLKWLYRERARLVGTDAPTQVSLVSDRPPEVAPEVVEAVRAALQNGQTH